MFIGSAHATEMCAKNDTVVIPLDATVKGDGKNYNAIEWMWWSEYTYGNIYGISTCLSLQEVRDIQNDSTYIVRTYAVLNSDDDTLIGRLGNDKNGNQRLYCHCKMIHPMSSNWVEMPQGSCSAQPCVDVCSNYAFGPGGTDYRTNMFNSIGASMAE